MVEAKKKDEKKTAKVKAVKKAEDTPKSKTKPEAKTEKSAAKTKDTKVTAETKADAKIAVKEEKKKIKKEKISRKIIVKPDKETIKARNLVLGKSGLPVFRGQFGKRSVRKKSNDKWDKWRFPRGIDVRHEMSDGYKPKEGFRRPKAIRDIHPSGFREVAISTITQLETVPKGHAIRVSGTVGRRRKLNIVDKAIEKKIKVLNP